MARRESVGWRQSPAGPAAVGDPARVAGDEQGGDPVLRLAGVSMVYPDGTRALDPVTLEVGCGESVALLGPSGCGKSTLLRIAAGLLEPGTGVVEGPGESLAVVFQDPTLLPWRSTQRNVELLAELKGMPKAARRQRAREAIRLVGLAGFEGHKPRSLSGGMKMRAALARALMLQPALMLFDEPFGALDEITRRRMGDELLRVTEGTPTASVFVTHSITEAILLCDRVVVMTSQPGRFLASHTVPLGRPRDASMRFAPEFTALAARIERDLEHELGSGD